MINLVLWNRVKNTVIDKSSSLLSCFITEYFSNCVIFQTRGQV